MNITAVKKVLRTDDAEIVNTLLSTSEWCLIETLKLNFGFVYLLGYFGQPIK